MSEQSGRNEPPPRQGNPGADPLADLQRWLIRSSAKNVRRELEDQVRRTLGSQRQDPGDVWDVATTENPAEVGEAPECQWCPICRAARRMRESGPGLAGQLSGAGDAVATAVQDAISVLDSLLARSGGTKAGPGASRDGAPDGGPGGGPAAEGPTPWESATEAGDAADPANAADQDEGQDGRGHGPGDRG